MCIVDDFVGQERDLKKSSMGVSVVSFSFCLVLDLKVQSVSKQDCKVCTLPFELECTLCTLREGRAVGWERPEKKKSFIFSCLWKGCYGLKTVCFLSKNHEQFMCY